MPHATMEILTNGWNVLIILLGFGVLIFIHELGHFMAARWAGIRCESFAVGMGPVLGAWRTGIGWRAHIRSDCSGVRYDNRDGFGVDRADSKVHGCKILAPGFS